MQKIKVLTQDMRKLYAFPAIFETERITLWLIKVLHVTKRYIMGFMASQVNCMQKIKDLNQEKKDISLIREL